MKFKANRDLIYVLLYLANLVIGICLIVGLLSIDINFMSILITILLGSEIILLSIMFLNCYYIVDNNKIKAVIGFVSLDIRIKDIKKISICKNMTFSFALSRRRIELLWGNNKRKNRNKIYVSPKNYEKFIELIELKNSGVSNENK